MANCPSIAELEAYYDRELDAARRAMVELHIGQCPQCAAKLAELTAMSGLFARVEQPRLLPMAQVRLRNKIDDAMQGGLVRIAWALSGVAACILVGGSVWLMRGGDVPQVKDSAPSSPPWVTVATTADTETAMRDAATPAAQWYLADASSRTDELP